MKDRERTIYELCRFYEEGLCSSPETPKRTNECIKGECVVFEGYTRQPEPKYEAGASWCPQGRAYDGVTDSLPLPEPSPERVEVVADAYYDFTVKQGWKLAGFETEIRTASYEFAREIFKLFPVPELKALESNPYFIVERVGMDTETSYNKYPEFQVYEDGKLAQLAQDQDTLRKRREVWRARNIIQANYDKGDC